MAQVATAPERAAEPKFAVAESPDELALELLGGGPHSSSLPVVRLTAAWARGARNRRRGSNRLHGAPGGRHPSVLARGARNRHRGSSSHSRGRDGHRRHPFASRPTE